MYTADIALMLSVCYLVVVVCYGSYTTVQVPSGPNSTLESYLCNQSVLSDGTSLQLEAGEHVIHGGPFCSVRNLSDIAITGSGRDFTVVRCSDSGRGLKFSFVGNLTIAFCRLRFNRYCSRSVFRIRRKHNDSDRSILRILLRLNAAHNLNQFLRLWSVRACAKPRCPIGYPIPKLCRQLLRSCFLRYYGHRDADSAGMSIC